MNSYFKKRILFYIIFLLSLLTITVSAEDRPFGTIKVTNDLYFDETEVDVASWLSYYSWIIIHEGLGAAQKVLPDSSAVEPELWAYIKNKSTDYIDMQARYSLQPVGYFGKECKECAKYGSRLSKQGKFCALLAFPITGVTYEQVKGFCEWRTRVEGNNKLVFRLPTPREWTDFALNGLSETERKNGFSDSLNNKKCAKFNYSISCNCGKDDYQGKLNGIGLYTQEKTGAFDVFGNVSEMTSVKGIAKGGNFKLHANQCHADSIQNYTKPQIWLGFRCIAVKGSDNKENTNTQSATIKNVSPDTNTGSNLNTFTDPRDGKTYPTVLIGNQTWMAANLAYKPENGKYWAYAKEQSNVDKYGYLYNWETSKNVCPTGWHLPSKEEFEALVQTIGGDANGIYKKLVPSGSSGFSVLSAGLRFDMDFTPIDGGSAFWSSTENGKKRAWGFTVGRLEPKAYVDDGWYKNYGLSVRCIKDK
jgi:uncharacterized protein (TIGR02145 family)